MNNQGITPEELSLLLSNNISENSSAKSSALAILYRPRALRTRRKKWWHLLFR
jgi:hypothetical protein